MKHSEQRCVGRRDFLTLASATGVALATTGLAAESQEQQNKRHVLRFAHMTDIHMQPERAAGPGFTAALHHIQGLAKTPQLIITGGDTVMETFGATDVRTAVQWELFHHVIRNECSLPVRSCIGNHDVWGWNKEKSLTTGEEALWGKKRAVEELHLPHRYYSYDLAGWHFVILDSTQTDGGSGYVGGLDEAQFQWLVQDLEQAKDRPTLLVSHHPIFTITAFMDHKKEEGDWIVSQGAMQICALQLKDLFKQNPQVKLCLSGHIHLVDRVEYCGVTYICDGAVSGAWWKGDRMECDEGYGVVDLYDDGTFDHEYVPFGWTPRA